MVYKIDEPPKKMVNRIHPLTRGTYVCMVCIYMCIYIYMCVCRERERNIDKVNKMQISQTKKVRSTRIDRITHTNKTIDI